MMIEHRRMSQWRVGLVVVVLASACTKPNPQSCQDGTCTDPAFPFCDVDGALAGEEETCIAVACTANEFVACRGDRAITCNTTGTDYELELCSGGCSEAAGGCRLCEPNETVCENGRVQTCDASGVVVAGETCALGCFENEPRCRKVDPSNGLAAYLDMAPNAPDLISYPALVFDASTGEVTDLAGTPIVVPSFPVASSGPGLRVFVVKRAHFVDITVRATNATGLASPAAAIVASGGIIMTGRLTASSGGVTAGCTAGVGGFSNANGVILNSGGGGGGHATAGGAGGDLVGVFAGGAGGAANGTETLIPLRGGCPAGGFPARGGGGAIQLVSASKITIEGVIDVHGADGDCDVAPDYVNSVGAGAGGGILLEAPQVELGATAKLIAKGGGGGAAGPSPPPRHDTANPALGATCVSQRCSSGGNGAAPGFEATSAASVTRPGNAGEGMTGAGGGGMGRVRINTKSGTYTKASSAVEAAVVTTGVVSTR